MRSRSWVTGGTTTTTIALAPAPDGDGDDGDGDDDDDGYHHHHDHDHRSCRDGTRYRVIVQRPAADAPPPTRRPRSRRTWQRRRRVAERRRSLPRRTTEKTAARSRIHDREYISGLSGLYFIVWASAATLCCSCSAVHYLMRRNTY